MAQYPNFLPESKRPLFQDLVTKSEAFYNGKTKYPVQQWKGYRLPSFFFPETAEYAYEKLEMDQNAVYIASYPKTGTNWCLGIVHHILHGDNPKEKALFKSVPWTFWMLEMGDAQKYDLLQHMPLKRKIYLTHLPAELVNVEKIKKTKGKVIYVIRNPKDQAVSWFEMTKKPMFDHLRDGLGVEWPEFFNNYVHGKHGAFAKEGEWYPEHILGWYKYKGDSDVLFLQFEEMKKDLPKQVKLIAKFLDVELSDDRVNEIADATSFDSMKKAVQSDASMLSKNQSTVNFLRKGQVGSWRQTFSDDQSEVMDKIIAEKLGKADINFIYDL